MSILYREESGLARFQAMLKCNIIAVCYIGLNVNVRTIGDLCIDFPQASNSPAVYHSVGVISRLIYAY